MPFPGLRLDSHAGGVRVITLQATPSTKKGGVVTFENRFNLSLVQSLNLALDAILQDEESRAVVVSGGDEANKFFSNGHDIAWLEQAMDKNKGQDAFVFIQRYYELLARFMTLPLPTVAAINGHAFAGGCLLAMAQDFRVMTATRGFLCMNEIDMVSSSSQPAVESKIKPGVFADADGKMTAVLQSKISSPILLRDVFLRGVRMDGTTALAEGLVDQVSSTEGVLQAAVELAREVGKKAHFRNRRTVGVLKLESHRRFVDVLLASRL